MNSIRISCALFVFIFFIPIKQTKAQNDDVLDRISVDTNKTYMMEEDKFFDRILNGYDRSKSPYEILSVPDRFATFGTPATTVSFTIHIHHLRIPQLMNPTVKYNALVIEEWSDSRIAWNPADFNGKQRAAVPFGLHIWTPQIYSYTRGYTPASVLHGNRQPRYTMKVDEKTMSQAARIEMRVRHDGALECAITGSFPFEHFSCVGRFLMKHRTYEIGLKVHNTNIMLKKFDMEDDDDQYSLNGWKIHSATQKVKVYNSYMEPNGFREVLNETARKKGFKRHDSYAIELRLEMSRSMTSIAIVTLLPFTIMAILILFAWILPISWSKYYQVGVLYILLIVSQNCLYKVPTYHDRFGGLDLMALSLWIMLFISLVAHLMFENFPAQIKQIGIRFESLIYSLLPSLKSRLHSWDERRLSSKEEDKSLPLGVELLRLFCLCLLIISLFVLTIISLF